MPITFVDLLRSANKNLRHHLDQLCRRELSPTAVELQSLSDSIERVTQAWRNAAPPGNSGDIGHPDRVSVREVRLSSLDRIGGTQTIQHGDVDVYSGHLKIGAEIGSDRQACSEQ